MRRLSALLILISLSATLRLGAAPPPKRPFEAATDAWERGDYATALSGYLQVLAAPGGDAFFEPIALTTGELFETRELTADGRAPRFSPDNKYIAYESGLETSRRTRILRNDPSLALVADLPGVSATFSSTLNQVAYLKIPENDEIRRASARARTGIAYRAESQSADTDADVVDCEAFGDRDARSAERP